MGNETFNITFKGYVKSLFCSDIFKEKEKFIKRGYEDVKWGRL